MKISKINKILIIIITAILLSGCETVLIAHHPNPTPHRHRRLRHKKVLVLPNGYITVIVRDKRYHYHKGVYYQKVPSGYEVVNIEEPKIVTVNISDKNGSYTAVKLKRYKDGFIGPQGEVYPEFPSIEQLKVMYSK